MKLEKLRRQYSQQGLSRADLDPDPIRQFDTWYQQVAESGYFEPGAMSLATVDSEGQPSQRTVLLKTFDEHGFVFYTNYGSRKATQIATNPKVSLLFAWVPLARQVNITGFTEKVSAAESLKYFVTRPHGSQIGAWASAQSEMVNSRSILESGFERMKQKFSKGEVPLPDFWGGYRVIPDTIEFWQGRGDRLHDRFEYSRTTPDNEWQIRRLAP